MKFLTGLIALLIATCLTVAAKEIPIKGKIIDAETKKPVPGATVHIVNSAKGTYTSANGTFKLMVNDTLKLIKFSSIGYSPKTIDLNKVINNPDFEISLKPSSYQSKGTSVQGNYPYQIIQSAIDRKKENSARKKTLSSTLYSKINVELDDKLAAAVTSSKESLVITGSLSNDTNAVKAGKYFIIETISKHFRDYEKNVNHTEIIQRRQTRNIPAADNVMAITEFMDFTDDEINFFNTKFKTPLSVDALSYYDYSYSGIVSNDGRKVYVIDYKPKSSFYPCLTGQLMIIDSTFDLIEISVTPAEKYTIQFVENINFIEKFKEVERNIWTADYFEVAAKMHIEVVSGLMDFSMGIKTASIMNDILINIPLPDSLYRSNWEVIVAKDADSAKPGFWENNALTELTEQDKQIYKEVDAAVDKLDSTKHDSTSSLFNRRNFDWYPYLDFNRVQSIGVGLGFDWNLIIPAISPGIVHEYAQQIGAEGYYSFGQQRLFGNSKLTLKLADDTFKLRTIGKLFSEVVPTGQESPYHHLVNTFAAALFHADYYDYMRKDGFSVAAEADYKILSIAAEYENSRQMSLDKTTENSIFSKELWRENPAIDAGSFQRLSALIAIGNKDYYKTYDGFQYFIQATGSYTLPDANGSRFRSVSGEAGVNLPLFYTGYTPIGLNLALRGGLSDNNVTLQSLFIMRTRLLFYSMSPAFLSADFAEFGGNSYFEGFASLNLSDFFWRGIGLPLFQGRGPELLLTAAAAKYESSRISAYKDTQNEFYSEVGFKLRRIPTLISNLIYWEINASWGVGPLGSGRFGWSLNVNMPF